MNVRFFSIFLIAVLAAACSATDYRSRKHVTQGIDYSRPAANEAYYEFTSDIPSSSAAFEENLQKQDVPSTTEETLGEDEDFTSDNIASTYGTYGDVVVNVATHKFKLGPSASRKEMNVFQKSLDKAYAVALHRYRPSGFTYAMSSVGAVNPLSDIEVRCKLSERSANTVGQATCTQFFNTIKSTYLELIKEAK